MNNIYSFDYVRMGKPHSEDVQVRGNSLWGPWQATDTSLPGKINVK